jgi:hypothetical protein
MAYQRYGAAVWNLPDEKEQGLAVFCIAQLQAFAHE